MIRKNKLQYKDTHTYTNTQTDLFALSSPSFPCTSFVTSAASRLCARRLPGSSLCCSISLSTSARERKVNSFRYLLKTPTICISVSYYS